jgi:hypothetical protein
MPVAVAVDAVVDDVFGKHLHHADFPGPGALRVHRVEIAMLEQGQRGEDLRPEDMRTAAVMGQRHQRVERVVIALERAEIRLESPEGQEDAARHAEAALDLVEDGAPAFCVAAPVVDPVLGNQAAGELGEGHGEDALPPIRIDGALGVAGMHEEGVDGRLRMAAHLRFGPQVLHELAEIAAALLRLRRADRKRAAMSPAKSCFFIAGCPRS